MKWHVSAVVLTLGLLAVSPVSAAVIDFATDPNLATEWTQTAFYNNPSGATVTWNAANQNLDLTSAAQESLARLYKTGTTRSDSEAVTLTLSNYVGTMNDTSTSSGSWTCAGLLLSTTAAPLIGGPEAPVFYSFYFQKDAKGTGFSYRVNKNLADIFTYDLSSVPDTMTFTITRDGADYVFSINDGVNNQELFRDSSLPDAGTLLPYYSVYWGSSGWDTLSVSVDDFGTIVAEPSVVPEPNAVALLIAGLMGLAFYVRRK